MFSESQIDADLKWATKVAGILTEAADEFHQEVEMLEKKWLRQKRIDRVYPEGILTLKDKICLKGIYVNIEVMSYETSPPDREVGWNGGVEDYSFQITNLDGRAMNWLKKYLTPKDFEEIETYIFEEAFYGD